MFGAGVTFRETKYIDGEFIRALLRKVLIIHVL